MSATATNIDHAGQPYPVQYPGITVNRDIPVAAMEPWKREALRKVIGFEKLAPNWDGCGSPAPNLATRQAAINLLLNAPGDYEKVRIVPISGGGYQFEWTVGDKDLEISIDGNANIEALRVENGIPLEDKVFYDLPALFGWISSR